MTSGDSASKKTPLGPVELEGKLVEVSERELDRAGSEDASPVAPDRYLYSSEMINSIKEASQEPLEEGSDRLPW